MPTTCTNCGTDVAAEATFCKSCGAVFATTRGTSPVAPGRPVTRAAPDPDRRRRQYILVGSATIIIAALAATAFQWWRGAPDAQPVPAVATEATPLPEPASLAQLAEEAEVLARNHAEVTRAMQDTIARYQTMSGGALPEGVGSGLTPELRGLLAERLKNESMGTASLLQDLLTKDQELQTLNSRIDELDRQLPYSVTAAEGQRHERIAMDFLREQGLTTDDAYRLVSQASLTEPLLSGFRVFLMYRGGQLGTWVTQGTAGASPQAVRDRVAALAAEERDAAVHALEATKADRDDLRNLAGLADRSLQNTQADLRAMTAAAEREQARNATLRYVVGSKSELVKGKVIDNGYRLLPLRTEGTAFLASSPSDLPPIDPSAYGLRRLNRVTVVPGLVIEGEDYRASNVDGFLSMTILRPDRFAHYAKYFVIVLE